MSSIPEVIGAFKSTLTTTGLEIFGFVPDSPTLPAVCIYLERWPFDVTAGATFVLWCLAGTTEMQGAQELLMSWLSDDGPSSLTAALDEDETLGGVVSSSMPVEVRNWGVVLLPDGRRVLQAELIVDVLR